MTERKGNIMPTTEEIDTRNHDRMVTALKSELFTSMRTAAAQLRASSMGGRERLFRDATPIGISIMVEVDQETYNTLDVAPLNNLMAAAVDRATDFALNKADALGSDGCFTARLSKVTDPVQVSIVTTISPL
jgi:hypothetical protein